MGREAAGRAAPDAFLGAARGRRPAARLRAALLSPRRGPRGTAACPARKPDAAATAAVPWPGQALGHPAALSHQLPNPGPERMHLLRLQGPSAQQQQEGREQELQVLLSLRETEGRFYSPESPQTEGSHLHTGQQVQKQTEMSP